MRLHWITYSIIAYFFIFFQQGNTAKIDNGDAGTFLHAKVTGSPCAVFSAQKHIAVKQSPYHVAGGHLLLLQNIFETDNFLSCRSNNNPIPFLHTTCKETKNAESIDAPPLPLYKSFSTALLSKVFLFPNHFFW